MLEWHRLFGLGVTDLFIDSAYGVDLERDLSQRQQRVDMVIIRKVAGGPIPELPDGFDNLSWHNIVTYKSPRQALDAWTLDELLGHFVNYRKQISPRRRRCCRLMLFACTPSARAFLASWRGRLRWKESKKASMKRYRVEGIAMPYTWDDFEREYKQEVLEQLTPKERLKGLSAEQRLKGLPVELRLKGLYAAEIEAYLKKLQRRKQRKSR